VSIPLDDVVAINYGTNWKDKINFIEIRPQFQQQSLAILSAEIKAKSQIYDSKAYQREGFKPLFQTIHYFPYDETVKVDPIRAMDWKFLMREWYFNTHLMLNGSVTIIGQDEYISVGDNILIPADALGSAPINAQHEIMKKLPFIDFYLCAHVESVSHNFITDSTTGARSFTTTINFVRGVLTNEDGQIFTSLTMPLHTDTALDKYVDDSISSNSYNNNNVASTISNDDPSNLFTNF
jgi:hypothetical protein